MFDGKLLEFETKDGLKLNGFLVGPEKSHKCIVYVHGMTGNFYGHTLPFLLARKVQELETSVFSMNTRGHDVISVIRSSKRGRKNHLTGGTDLERFEDSVLDIDGAIKKLEELGFTEFILAGHSTGCQKVAYYQYKRMNKRVTGVILLAPADDYAMHKKELGKRFGATIRVCKDLIKKGRGNEPDKIIPSHFSPSRFLSVADLRNVEARLFYYEGELKEFSKINSPICAIFGTKEEYAYKPVVEYMRILKKKSSAARFSGVVIDGATHSFRDHEDLLSDFILKWLFTLEDKEAIPTREILEINERVPLASLGYS